MPALYHQSQWTLKSMLKASFMEENKKILRNTCWHPHQFSQIRPKTQRLMHFLTYKCWEEDCLRHPLQILSMWMGEKVLGSTSLSKPGGRGEAILGLQKSSLLLWTAQLIVIQIHAPLGRPKGIKVCYFREVSDYSNTDEKDLFILRVKKQRENLKN